MHTVEQRAPRPVAIVLCWASYLVLLTGFLATPSRAPIHTALIGFSLLYLNVLIAVVGVRAARAPGVERRTRQAWFLIAASAVLAILGIVGYVGTGHAGQNGLTPSIGDIPHSLCAPAMLAGVLRLPHRARTRRASLKIALDAVTVIAGGFMAMWYFVLGPAFIAKGLAPVQVLTAVSYPVGDLVLALGAIVVLLRGTSSARRPVALLIVGLTCLVVADTYNGYLKVHPGSDSRSEWLISLLMTAWFLIALAGATQRRLSLLRQDDAVKESAVRLRPASLLPYGAAALACSLLLVAAARQGLYPWVGLVIGATVVTASVAARQLVALRENHELVVTDSLTGLANRVELHRGLTRALDRAARTGGSVTVLQIDVNSFKQINDTLGHEAGDRVLVGFAEILRRSVLGADIVARLGGDEFVVVLESETQAGVDAGVAVARRILANIGTPIDVKGQQLFVGASLGIASLQGNEASATDALRTLLHRADTAMYVAKQSKPESVWQLFAEGMEQKEASTALLASDLRTVVQDGQLRVHYQPIVALNTQEITGVEALVRWQHPTRGLLFPGDFIELAEKTGAIEDLGAWVLDTAARQVVAWQALIGRRLQLNVNLSPRQLERLELAREFAAILTVAGLDPADLVLEVTESAVVSDDSGAAALVALRELGIRIALDDFGTGYSSLRYLTRLPVDTLKLDRCFVNELDGTSEGSVVASAVIRLSDILHLDLVAEGIETAAQLAELTLLGCRTGQGFFIARPLTADAFADFLTGPQMPVDLSSSGPRAAPKS